MPRVLSWVTVVVMVVAPSIAFACAACACGDPTLTVMGAGKSFAGRLRLSAEWRRRAETAPAEFGPERVTEDRWSLGLAWAPIDTIQLAATLPIVHRQLETATLARTRAMHVGDADFMARWIIVGARGRHTHQTGLTAGLRLPTGPEVSHLDETLALDLQPGTGSYMPSIGAWYGAFAHPWSAYASATVVASTDGHRGFNPGTTGLATAYGQYQWGTDIALRAGLDGRYNGRSTDAGQTVQASGGGTLFAAAGLSYSPLTDTQLNGTVRWPVADARRGGERSTPSVSLGLTQDL